MYILIDCSGNRRLLQGQHEQKIPQEEPLGRTVFATKKRQRLRAPMVGNLSSPKRNYKSTVALFVLPQQREVKLHLSPLHDQHPVGPRLKPCLRKAPDCSGNQWYCRDSDFFSILIFLGRVLQFINIISLI